MRSLRPLAFVAALAAAVVASPSVKAEQVFFGTDGVFENGTSTLDLGAGKIISFIGNDLNSVNASPISQATFGSFDTSLFTSGDLTPISTTFTLNIVQLLPTPPVGSETASFSGSLTGTLNIDSSGNLFLLFDGPLSASITSEEGLEVIYSIVSGDSFTPGRVNLNPSTTNGGISTIAGQVEVVPEPSTLALAGIALPLLAAYRLRRKSASIA